MIYRGAKIRVMPRAVVLTGFIQCRLLLTIFHNIHLRRLTQSSPSLHAKHTTTASSTLSRRTLILHLLADLDIDLEELGYAAIEAHGFAFIQVGFAVVARYAFLRTR
jgi:hypothetical protein